MPQPSTAVGRNDLGDSVMEFDLLADIGGFIGLRVLPAFEASVASGNFGVIPLEQLLQERDLLRSPGSGYSRGDFKFRQESFATQEYGAEEVVDDNEAKLYADYFDAEVVAAARARHQLLLNHEKRVANALFNPNVWTGSALTTAITNEWDKNHISDADPIGDVHAACDKVYDGSGLWPNALIVNRKVFRNLRNLDDIVDRITSAGAGDPAKPSDITAEQLARVFDLKYVLVAGGTRNTANKGQTATPGQIWSSEYAMVARIAETNDLKEPCLGRTFHWGEDGSQVGGTFEEYREEKVRGNILRNRHQVQEKILYVEAAHLLSNVTTLP